MGINGVCPSCGAVFDLVHALTDGEARAALAAALEIDAGLARLVPPYIALLAPPGRRMAWPKLARLLRELAELVSAGSVTRNRESRAAPLALWREGLEQVLAARDAGSLDLPLSGHGLLCEIVFRRAGKHASAAAAATRPLHPSHRPAQRDDGARREAGLQAIGALAATLKRRSTTDGGEGDGGGD